MKKIALRGYGYHGKDMELVLSGWQEEYRITAVYDNNYKKIVTTDFLGLPVRSPDTLEEDWKAGLFDEVLVTVYNPEQNRTISDDLEKKGIPVCVLDMQSTMEAPETFPQAEEMYWTPEGYRLFCFSHLFLTLTPRSLVPFVFDDAGRVNKAWWHSYQRMGSPYARWYRPDPSRPYIELKGEWALLTGVYGTNYWHFTFETIDRICLLEREGYKGKYLLCRPAFAPALCRLAGIEERIVWLDELEAATNYRIERLYYPALRDAPIQHAASLLAEYAERVREKLADDGEYPSRIYVKRIGTRRLSIPQEWLDRNGFVTIIPEEHTVEEQIRYFMHADIVLTPHGANSANSLYMKKGSVFIETFPADYINPCCMETLNETGVYWLMLVEQKYPGSASEHPSGEYQLPSIMLKNALNAAEKLLENKE